MGTNQFVECGPEELTDIIEQLQGIEHMARLFTLRAALAMEASKAHLQDGTPSIEGWLCYRLNVEPATARQWMEVARKLEDLPLLASMFESGQISWDQLRYAAEVATPETDEHWASEALRLNCAQLKGMVRAIRAASRKISEEDGSWLDLRWSPDHEKLFINGRLEADKGAIFCKAIESLASEQPRLEDGSYEAFGRQAAQALVELAGVHLEEEADAPRAVVVIHVEAESLDAESGAGEIEGAGFVHCETVRRLACDSRIQLALKDRSGKSLGVGRASRNIPPWLMHQLRKRDIGCKFPGCSRKRFLHAHHIEHWAHGGSTDMDNLVLLCGAHHRMMHEAGWLVETGEKVRFRRPDGRLLAGHPSPLRQEVALRVFPEAVLS
jgi:hypothetical protein